MSMFSCPECGERISSAALTCPRCGLPISGKLFDGGVAAAAILNRLAASEDRQSLLAIAADESANPELLALVARIGDVDVTRRLAQNGSTPSFVLAQLAYLDDKEVLVSVARNPQASSETLAALYRRVEAADKSRYGHYVDHRRHWYERDYEVEFRALKIALALNHNTPVDVLSQLHGDDDRNVSAAVFGNCKLPKRFFAEYMSSGIGNAGPSGLLNPLIPYRDLARQFDSSTDASQQVAKNSQLYGFRPEEYDSKGEYAYNYIRAMQGAGFPRLPRESIEAIESIGVGFPREIVLNPAATLDVLVQALGESLAREVWTAKDPCTPQLVIEKLYRDGEGLVRVAAAMNPSLPESVFEERFGRRQEGAAEDTVGDGMDDDCGPSPDEIDYSGWERHSDWVEYGIGADIEYWNDAAMDELQPMIDAERTARAELQDAVYMANYERKRKEAEEAREAQYQSFLEEYAFASNPSAPAYALHSLSMHGDDIARAVASNPNAPQDLLRLLYDDDACWDAVIMNPSCSIALLESLDNQEGGNESRVSNVETRPPLSAPPASISSNTSDDEMPF